MHQPTITDYLHSRHPHWRYLKHCQYVALQQLFDANGGVQGLYLNSPFAQWVDHNTDWQQLINESNTVKGKPIIQQTFTDFAFRPSSVDNIIIPIGNPLEQLPALLEECYLTLKPSGCLVLFYPNMFSMWQLSPYMNRLFKALKTNWRDYPLSKLYEPIGFNKVANLTIAIQPPLLSQWRLKGGLCQNNVNILGQFNLLVLQKHLPIALTQTRQTRPLLNLLLPQLSPTNRSQE